MGVAGSSTWLSSAVMVATEDAESSAAGTASAPVVLTYTALLSLGVPSKCVVSSDVFNEGYSVKETRHKR